MPYPSRGCRTCRQRRLKCDETRPICGQCNRSSRVCLGFESNRDGLPFRSENAYASGVARRPRRPRANESRKTASQSDVSRSSEDNSLDHIPQGPDLPLEEMALNFYVQGHMFAAEQLPVDAQGWLERTIMLCAESDPGSLLGSVVSAVSLATFGRTKASLEALELGNRKYAQALAKTKTAISKTDETITDHFLLAVMMLGVYEHAVSKYNREYLLAESFRHQSGAMALLRLRKAKHSKPQSLDRLVRHMIIKQAVIHAVALPEWVRHGADFGEEGIDLGLDACLVRLASLRNRGQELWRDAPGLQKDQLGSSLRNIIADALDIDRTLARWAADLPREWIYTTQGESSPGQEYSETIERDPERLQYGSMISLYPSLHQAATWNRYRASRVVAGCILVKALQYLLDSIPESDVAGEISKTKLSQQIAARENVQGFVDDICASVPYHFDVLGSNSGLPVDGKPRLDQLRSRRAYLLSWPLTICMAVSGIPYHQRMWIRCRVLDISRITGNGALELVANMEQHVNLRGDSYSMSEQRAKENMSPDSE